jgi:hypothetical protein
MTWGLGCGIIIGGCRIHWWLWSGQLVDEHLGIVACAVHFLWGGHTQSIVSQSCCWFGLSGAWLESIHGHTLIFGAVGLVLGLWSKEEPFACQSTNSKVSSVHSASIVGSHILEYLRWDQTVYCTLTSTRFEFLAFRRLVCVSIQLIDLCFGFSWSWILCRNHSHDLVSESLKQSTLSPIMSPVGHQTNNTLPLLMDR